MVKTLIKVVPERCAVDEDGNRISYFAEPCREEMTFSNFLDFLRQSRTCSPPEVPYMQVLVVSLVCVSFHNVLFNPS